METPQGDSAERYREQIVFKSGVSGFKSVVKHTSPQSLEEVCCANEPDHPEGEMCVLFTCSWTSLILRLPPRGSSCSLLSC